MQTYLGLLEEKLSEMSSEDFHSLMTDEKNETVGWYRAKTGEDNLLSTPKYMATAWYLMTTFIDFDRLDDRCSYKAVFDLVWGGHRPVPVNAKGVPDESLDGESDDWPEVHILLYYLFGDVLKIKVSGMCIRAENALYIRSNRSVSELFLRHDVTSGNRKPQSRIYAVPSEKQKK